MGFMVYAVHTGNVGKRKENSELTNLLRLVAKKYRIVVKKPKSNKYVELYSEGDKGYVWSRRNTMRFVAQQATLFVRRKMPQDETKIGMYVSRRQISRLADINSNYTSVHAIITLTVILQLLLYNVNDSKYLDLISPDVSPVTISPDEYADEKKELDLVCTYLKGHILRLVQNVYYQDYAPDTHPLCEYIMDCYETLNQLAGVNTYHAVRYNQGNQITNIRPEDYPEYPVI